MYLLLSARRGIHTVAKEDEKGWHSLLSNQADDLDVLTCESINQGI